MIRAGFFISFRVSRWMLACLSLCIACSSDPTIIDYQPQPPGSANYWITYHRNNSGLPSQSVTHIAIGAQDIVWLALKDEGLVRFHGSEWTHFTEANSPLPDDHIHELASDGGEGVWIATPAGLAHLDARGWSAYHTGNAPLPAHDIVTLAVAGNGDLWFSVGRPPGNPGFSGQLFHFDGQTWTVFHKDNSPILQQETLARLHVAPDGTLWGGYEDAFGLVSRTQAGEWTIFDQNQTGFLIPSTGSLTTDSRGKLWVGIDYAHAQWTDPIRPLLLRRESFSWKVENPRSGNGILYEGITSLAATKAGIVWAVVDQDLARFDGFDWRVWSRTTADFPHTSLNDLAVDSQDRLWVVTDLGIMVIDP